MMREKTRIRITRVMLVEHTSLQRQRSRQPSGKWREKNDLSQTEREEGGREGSDSERSVGRTENTRGGGDGQGRREVSGVLTVRGATEMATPRAMVMLLWLLLLEMILLQRDLIQIVIRQIQATHTSVGFEFTQTDFIVTATGRSIVVGSLAFSVSLIVFLL
jgi:hypothetical protein